MATIPATNIGAALTHRRPRLAPYPKGFIGPPKSPPCRRPCRRTASSTPPSCCSRLLSLSSCHEHACHCLISSRYTAPARRPLLRALPHATSRFHSPPPLRRCPPPGPRRSLRAPLGQHRRRLPRLRKMGAPRAVRCACDTRRGRCVNSRRERASLGLGALRVRPKAVSVHRSQQRVFVGGAAGRHEPRLAVVRLSMHEHPVISHRNRKIVSSIDANQAVQMCATSVVISGASDGYLLQKTRHSLEFLRTIANILPYSNYISARERVRSDIAHAPSRAPAIHHRVTAARLQGRRVVCGRLLRRLRVNRHAMGAPRTEKCVRYKKRMMRRSPTGACGCRDGCAPCPTKSSSPSSISTTGRRWWSCG